MVWLPKLNHRCILSKYPGHALHPTLEAIGCVEALNSAINSGNADSPYFLIHHSDRGVQYCCSDYIDLLNQEGILISMTQSGSPYDNALAERVNGIIKNEFYLKKSTRIIKRQLKRYPKL
jgi:putative transposase